MKKIKILSCILSFYFQCSVLLASSEPFVGEMLWVPYNFEPTDWAFCDGRLLPINQYSALYSLIGITFGGDGVTTFALPNVKGRLIIGATSTGANYQLGQVGGGETVDVNTVSTYLRTDGLTQRNGRNNESPDVNKELITAVADNSISTLKPYTTLNCIIALAGIYPSRS